MDRESDEVGQDDRALLDEDARGTFSLQLLGT